MNLKLFKKKEEAELVPVVVSVPDIKDYLVKEYERVQELKQENERLEAALELGREIKLKYEATLVTLDEYARRLENAEERIEKEKQKTARERQETEAQRDLVNSFKIKFSNAAITRDQIQAEVIEKTKETIVAAIKSSKGNLSKQKLCEIVAAVSVTWEARP